MLKVKQKRETWFKHHQLDEEALIRDQIVSNMLLIDVSDNLIDVSDERLSILCHFVF